MLKNVYVDSTQRHFKKGMTIIEVAFYSKYIDIELVCGNVWEIKKNLDIDPILKREIVKNMPYI